MRMLKEICPGETESRENRVAGPGGGGGGGERGGGGGGGGGERRENSQWEDSEGEAKFRRELSPG